MTYGSRVVQGWTRTPRGKIETTIQGEMGDVIVKCILGKLAET